MWSWKRKENKNSRTKTLYTSERDYGIGYNVAKS